MSQVFKCDRCGTIFDKNDYPKFIFFRQYTIDRIKWDMDICDRCQKELKEWFDNVQSEEN